MDTEILEAINNTPNAKYADNTLELDAVRYQKPEQAGGVAIRTGVFYLPEKKSPYQRYYTTGHLGYGGRQRIERRKRFLKPYIIKGASGGKAPERAYDAINGKNAYREMRQEVLKLVVMSFMRKTTKKQIYNVLIQYSGEGRLAWDILQNSNGGNTLPYAIQEHIVACSLRRAGYDAIIGYSKIAGNWRLSEVFDLTENEYPD